MTTDVQVQTTNPASEGAFHITTSEDAFYITIQCT